MPLLSDFVARTIDGTEIGLDRYAGRVVLVVNTASRRGFTPHYGGLEALWRTFAPRGFVVLGFPCNQFGGQEPGSEREIAAFCHATYDVSFPLFAKVEVNGAGAHPLFVWLRRSVRGALGTTRIKWNFTKFLIDRSGRPVRRFSPATKPERLRARVEALLG